MFCGLKINDNERANSEKAALFFSLDLKVCYFHHTIIENLKSNLSPFLFYLKRNPPPRKKGKEKSEKMKGEWRQRRKNENRKKK